MKEPEQRVDQTRTTMTAVEWNRLLDEHIENANKRAGEIRIPQVGMSPPDSRYSYQFGINNVLASEDLIRHYADAIGDTNPLWRDPSYYRNTRYGGIIAPPTFEVCIAPTYPIVNKPVLPNIQTMAAGAKHRYFKMIHAGDTFRVVDKYLPIVEKTQKGKPYRLYTNFVERSYINQRDEVVAVIEGGGIMVATPPGETEATKGSAYGGITRHRFTEEELDRIHRAYDEETRRGAETLYWEDVTEGEELKPIVAGPLDNYDTASFFQCVGYAVAYRVKWEMMKADLTFCVIDPETNEYRPSVSHLDDTVARTKGIPYGFGFAAQLEGLLAHLICNWMGDDGFLKRLDCQCRRIYIFGDAVWLHGKVVKKYIENGEHLVDLQLCCENQDDAILMPATATVRLVSRTD
jgi:acyl dehydratase